MIYQFQVWSDDLDHYDVAEKELRHRLQDAEDHVAALKLALDSKAKV